MCKISVAKMFSIFCTCHGDEFLICSDFVLVLFCENRGHRERDRESDQRHRNTPENHSRKQPERRNTQRRKSKKQFELKKIKSQTKLPFGNHAESFHVVFWAQLEN